MEEIDVLRYKVNALELQNNVSSSGNEMDKIEDLAKKLFMEIPNITRLSFEPTPEGLVLIVVHKFKTTFDALEEITNCIIQLEEAYPKIYFKPWVLHTSEVRPEHLNGSKDIFVR